MPGAGRCPKGMELRSRASRPAWPDVGWHAGPVTDRDASPDRATRDARSTDAVPSTEVNRPPSTSQGQPCATEASHGIIEVVGEQSVSDPPAEFRSETGQPMESVMLETTATSVATSPALSAHCHNDHAARAGDELVWQCLSCGRIERTGVRLGS